MRVDTATRLGQKWCVDLFIHYRPSERHSAEPIRRTLNFGRLFIVIILALLFSHNVGTRPGLWSALGVGLGVYIMLRAAIALGVTSPAATGWAQRKAAARDQWFPLFLFTVQSAFLLLSVAVFWITFCEIGFPARAWHHALIILFALAIPAYRVARERLLLEQNVKHDLAERFFRYLLVILVSVLLAGLLTPLLDLSRDLRADDQLVFLLLMWSATLLVSVVCVLMFVDHWIKAFRPAAKSSQAERSAGRVDNPRDAWGP